MAICVHGEICRAWMKRYSIRIPLSGKCPYGCEFFEKKELTTQDKVRMIFSEDRFIELQQTCYRRTIGIGGQK